MIGAAPGDVHSIPSAIFADVLRSFGVDVVDLGGSPEIESFVEAIRRNPSAVVVITMTGPGNHESVRKTVAALRRETPDVPISIGGGAVHDEETAVSLGADLWCADPREAAQLIADAAGQRQTAARSAS